MKTVRSLLEEKSNILHFVFKDTSVYDALLLMMDKNISATLIMEDNKLAGIFTERDYARKIILQGRASKTTLIKDVMTSDVLTVTSSESVERCMQLMNEKHFRHLPVVDNGVLTGMVSIGDLLKYVIEQQQNTIDHLQSYIRN